MNAKHSEKHFRLMNNQLTDKHLFSSGIQFYFLNEEQTTSEVCIYRRALVRNHKRLLKQKRELWNKHRWGIEMGKKQVDISAKRKFGSCSTECVISGTESNVSNETAQ